MTRTNQKKNITLSKKGNLLQNKHLIFSQVKKILNIIQRKEKGMMKKKMKFLMMNFKIKLKQSKEISKIHKVQIRIKTILIN